MNCSQCGSELPREAFACPDCGAKNASADPSEDASEEITVQRVIENYPPSTDYGVDYENPYSQSQYSQSEYNVLPEIQLPSQPKKRISKKMIWIGVILLLVISLVSVLAGTFFVSRRAVPTSDVNPYVKSAGIHSDLKLNSIDLSGRWDLGEDCHLAGKTITVGSADPKVNRTCESRLATYKNFSMEANISLVSDDGCAGFVFRTDPNVIDLSFGYVINICFKSYAYAFFSSEQKSNTTIQEGILNFVPKSSNTILLAVTAYDDGFTVFVDKNKIFSTNNNSYLQTGYLGFLSSQGGTFRFQNLKVWELSKTIS